jgi:DNA-binding MarR family transcriptional regulator
LYDATHTDHPFPDDEIRRLMRRLVRLVGVLEPHRHGEIKASLSEVMALGELADSAVLSQQELAGRLGLEKSTISRLVVAMEGRGWVSRQRDPGNRRYFQLRLTEEGRAAAEQVGQDLQSHHERVLGGLTPDERTALSAGLAGLGRVLDQEHRPRAVGGD